MQNQTGHYLLVSVRGSFERFMLVYNLEIFPTNGVLIFSTKISAMTVDTRHIFIIKLLQHKDTRRSPPSKYLAPYFEVKGVKNIPFLNTADELTWAWLKTVVMLKHPGHFTSMKKLQRRKGTNEYRWKLVQSGDYRQRRHRGQAELVKHS